MASKRLLKCIKSIQRNIKPQRVKAKVETLTRRNEKIINTNLNNLTTTIIIGKYVINAKSKPESNTTLMTKNLD